MGMMKRRIPSEIQAYKSQMFFGLTVRQVICLVCAAVLIVPTFIFVRPLVSDDTLGWILMIEIVPFGAVGWFSYNDMGIEKMAMKVIGFFFGARRRKWQFVNVETKVHDAVMQIEYEREAQERKAELAEEKARAKSEKTNKRKERKTK